MSEIEKIKSEYLDKLNNCTNSDNLNKIKNLLFGKRNQKIIVVILFFIKKTQNNNISINQNLIATGFMSIAHVEINLH